MDLQQDRAKSAEHATTAKIQRLVQAMQLGRLLRECALPSHLTRPKKTSGAVPMGRTKPTAIRRPNGIQRFADDSERFLSGEREVSHRKSSVLVIE
jgi:hypothetical protein